MENTENKVKIVDYTIDDSGMLGTSAVSVVDLPAIEVDFVALKAQKSQFAKVQDGEKRMLYGPALIPDQLIYRQDENGEPFYIRYSKEVIERVAHEYLKYNRQNNVTYMHEFSVAKMSVVENWIVGTPDKSEQLGFSLPEGTWFIGMKVDNDEVWNQVKAGAIKGFSIEGFFTELTASYLEEQKVEKLIEDFLSELDSAANE